MTWIAPDHIAVHVSNARGHVEELYTHTVWFKLHNRSMLHLFECKTMAFVREDWKERELEINIPLNRCAQCRYRLAQVAEYHLEAEFAIKMHTLV